MADSSLRGYALTKAFWDSERWIPDCFLDGKHTISSIRSSLFKMSLDGHKLMVHGDFGKFPIKTLNQFGDSSIMSEFTPLEAEASSRLDRLNVMLVGIVFHAWLDIVLGRQSCLVIITTLSQDEETEMLCKVLGSLTSRSVPVVLAVPDVNEMMDSIIFSEPSGSRIPVRPFPNLFNDPPKEEPLCELLFLEPPNAQPYSTGGFAMPENVDTCVFWDLEDYPLPPGLDLVSFVRNIKSYADSTGVSIYPYVVKEKDAKLFKDAGLFEDAEIKMVPDAPTDKVARLAKMMMDILLWSMDNCRPIHPRPALVVISKVLENDVFYFVQMLGRMQSTRCDVLLPLPAEKLPPPMGYYFQTVSWDVLTSVLGKRKLGDDCLVTMGGYD